MAKKSKSYKFCVVVITQLLITTGSAQRPSFAGSRPPSGLNQKDKYYSTTSQIVDIGNRFGSAITNQIPYGQPQKPPIGYPVVLPESVYTALTHPPTLMPTNSLGAPALFEDRLGETVNNTISSATTSSTIQRPGKPLDAHGDQLLIDRLNQTPIDKRPFWFINYQAIEAQRNGTATNFALIPTF